MPAGYGIKEDLLNVASSVGKVALPIATDLAGRYVAKKMGVGAKKPRGRPSKRGCGIHMHVNQHHEVMQPIVSKPKRGRPRKHGAGIGEDILHGVETVAPFLPLLL